MGKWRFIVFQLQWTYHWAISAVGWTSHLCAALTKNEHYRQFHVTFLTAHVDQRGTGRTRGKHEEKCRCVWSSCQSLQPVRRYNTCAGKARPTYSTRGEDSARLQTTMVAWSADRIRRTTTGEIWQLVRVGGEQGAHRAAPHTCRKRRHQRRSTVVMVFFVVSNSIPSRCHAARGLLRWDRVVDDCSSCMGRRELTLPGEVILQSEQGWRWWSLANDALTSGCRVTSSVDDMCLNIPTLRHWARTLTSSTCELGK